MLALQPMKTIPYCCLALLLSLVSTAFSQENGSHGRMWTFENPPLEYFENEYKFKPNEKWLDSLRLGSLRIGGEDILSGFGSASFVSPNGLIMTSSRCIRDAVKSSGGHNIVDNGLVAATPEQELRLQTRRNGWLTVAQLIKISNVTDEVDKGIETASNAAQAKQKREANKKAILEAARGADPKLVPQIVSLYHGAVFQLYQYKVYDDVRLVCVPHLQATLIGGDSDELSYPSYSVDFAFLRAYENGKPAETANHFLKWKSGGAEEGELVFVSGNPSQTKRLFTVAQLELERDIKLPIEIEKLTHRLRIWNEHLAPSWYEWSNFRNHILRSQYDLKAASGNLRGLQDAKLMAQKATEERAFKNRVMADKALAEKYGDLWNRIESVAQERRIYEARKRFYTTNGLGLFDAAVGIVQSCDPNETEENRSQAKASLNRWGEPLSDNVFGRAFFVDHIDRALGWLPTDDPFFTKVLRGRDGGEFLKAIYGDARFIPGHPEYRGKVSLAAYEAQRAALVKSGWKAIQDNEDPAIAAGRELVILMKNNRKLGDELDATEEALRAELANAFFECYGTTGSPDGTMTLRLTDGIVRGYATNGKTAPYRTTFGGLYARSDEFDNDYPFKLPKIWLDRQDRIEMTESLRFVSTNDITKGSSGSVVVNKELEVVGMVVDGNNESLHNDFLFKDDLPRAVSVHVDGIVEALVKIYDAQHIANELMDK